jgi:uncharacterized membrane protein
VTLPAAALLAAALALAGRALRWLTAGGALAAWLVGTAVFAAADLEGAALLGLFFVSGSVLTAAAPPHPRVLGAGCWVLGTADAPPIAKRLTDQAPLPQHPAPNAQNPGRAGGRAGGARTARQVLANGLCAALGALGVAAGIEPAWAILAGSLAAAQADTWATEIGAFARAVPRLVTTGRPVPAGSSGGVTPLGTGGGLVGAAAMAGLAWALGLPAPAAVLAGGVTGMVADSVLGATVQAVYYCEACSRETEIAQHGCAGGVRLVRGRSWIDNDAVNLLGSAVGGLVTAGVWFVQHWA